MFKKILCLIIASLFFMQVSYGADINDFIRGDDSDVVEGDETISTLDDQITNYLQEPLKRALTDHISGCTITVTDDEVLTVSAGSVVTTSSGGIRRMRQNTSTATVDNTAADVGGLDTGSVAANTWYYVYAIADADATTFTLILSASAANPTNGAALYYRLIGCALTDATSDWLKAYYIGDGNTVTVMWDIPISEVTTVSAGAWSSAVDCSSSMPSISTLGIFGLWAQDNAGTTGVAIRPNGTTWAGVAAEENSIFISIGGGTSAEIAGQRICATDSSQQIQYYSNTGDTDTNVDVEGFIFIR